MRPAPVMDRFERSKIRSAAAVITRPTATISLAFSRACYAGLQESFDIEGKPPPML